MLTNKDVFSNLDFDTWAYLKNLNHTEEFLLGKYLNKNAKTLEAGTGGGRIILGMKKLGFTSLSAFDYVPELIEEAKKKDTTASISFSVEDATALNYQDEDFEQIVYLQQILCCMEDESARLNAFKEAYRILKNGGTAVFSFLSIEDRMSKPFYTAFIVYLRLLRLMGNSKTSLQYIPWLKYKGKPNLGALLDKKPYMYWYKLEEAYNYLEKANFKIIAMGSDFQVNQGDMYTSLADLKRQPIQGGLYFVCTK
jgi:ubiquinone/menaquinone biosynthesis C-methylase UbiE